MNEKTIGGQIGKAIARDVIADDLPREWTGLDAADVDRIPDGMDVSVVEREAEAAYREVIDSAITVGMALAHVDDGEEWTTDLARQILAEGWANGEPAEGREVAALEIIAAGGSVEDEL